MPAAIAAILIEDIRLHRYLFYFRSVRVADPATAPQVVSCFFEETYTPFSLEQESPASWKRPGWEDFGGDLAAGNLDWMFEGGLTQNDFGVGAPNLHLADVRHVGWHRNLGIHLVLEGAFDPKFLQKVRIALGIDDLPVRVRGLRYLKVVREGEDVFAVLDGVNYSSGIGFGALELCAGVAFVGP